MNSSIYTASPTTAQATGNRVLRNTYLLLSMTLAFAAATAGVSMALNLPHPGLILTLVGYFGLLFLTSRYRDQALGLVFVFALTGFMGYTLGPILSAYIGMSGGPQVVTTALAATALVFVGLSGYAMTTRHDLSFMGGMLFVGILVAFLAGIAAVSLAVSAMFVLLMSGLILYETQQIVRGGETNYIMATVTLFVAIFNLFTSLLHLLGFASQE